MITSPKVAVIGAGLAGCETAWQLALRDIKVDLFEMRPTTMTPAHQTGNFAELVCSNSFKSTDLTNAHGLLKAEMEMSGSLIIRSAKMNSVRAGTALAVDRIRFSKFIEEELEGAPNVNVINREVVELEEFTQNFDIVVIACGPLISDSLAGTLRDIVGAEDLYFYDAIAPVVYADSIDMNIAFMASRYGKGGADYINCPMNEIEYQTFVTDLIQARKVPVRDFEKSKVFEGCLPIEYLAERRMETLSFGPLKPVGLKDPRTGQQPWAVLQLRSESHEDDLYNMVGCQTRMIWSDQKRIFRKIPGLNRCEFARMGSMHRNSYLNAPKVLNSGLELKNRAGLYVAGQLTGVEGYAESTASGIWAAMNIVAKLKKKTSPQIDPQTMIGGLINYLQNASSDNFQPMNSNFGLISDKSKKNRMNKQQRRRMIADRAINRWHQQLVTLGW